MSKLLAPNGKPSNLTPEQYKLVRTTEFKEWFGDWEKLENAKIRDSGIDEITLSNLSKNVSKIVDENGEPLVCYHGTSNNFSIFDLDKSGTKTDDGMWGKGFYFSSNKQYAELYANKTFDYKMKTLSSNGYVFDVFLCLKNPLILRNTGDIPKIIDSNKTYSENFRDTIIDKGYDGVFVKFEFKFRGGFDYELVSYYPKQIKLADGTNTTFDSNNPDIRYEQGGKIKKYWYKGLFNN